MIASLGLILLCQLIGEVIVRSLALPLPGPVLGLVLLLVLLLLRDRVRFLAIGPLATDSDAGRIEGVSRVLLANLSLLFVPAGVGIMVHANRIGSEWLPIVIALVVSTWVAIAVTALVTRALMRKPPADTPVDTPVDTSADTGAQP